MYVCVNPSCICIQMSPIIFKKKRIKITRWSQRILAYEFSFVYIYPTMLPAQIFIGKNYRLSNVVVREVNGSSYLYQLREPMTPTWIINELVEQSSSLAVLGIQYTLYIVFCILNISFNIQREKIKKNRYSQGNVRHGSLQCFDVTWFSKVAFLLEISLETKPDDTLIFSLTDIITDCYDSDRSFAGIQRGRN